MLPGFNLRDALEIGFARWRQNHPKGSRAEYFHEANKTWEVDDETFEWREVHKYRNKESAGRAFRKIMHGQTSGRIIARQSIAYGRRPIERRPVPYAPSGSWQVVVRFLNWTEDGRLVQCMDSYGDDCVLSFTAVSFEYKSILDAPYLQDELTPFVEEKVQEWINDGKYCPILCQTYRVEIYPTHRAAPTTVPYEIDEGKPRRMPRG